MVERARLVLCVDAGRIDVFFVFFCAAVEAMRGAEVFFPRLALCLKTFGRSASSCQS